MKYYLFLLLLIGCKEKSDIMKSPNDFSIEGLHSLMPDIYEQHNKSLINGYRCLAAKKQDSVFYYMGKCDAITMIDSIVIEKMKLYNK
jgi:hypothetical protein